MGRRKKPYQFQNSMLRTCAPNSLTTESALTRIFPIPCRIHLFPLRLTAGMVMGVCLVAGAGNL